MGKKKGGEEEEGFGKAKEEKGREGWREADTREQQPAANRRRTAENCLLASWDIRTLQQRHGV